MQVSEITFDLTNTSDSADVMAVLIPAMLRRNGALAGKFLKTGSFKDETGSSDISVANVLPAPGALSELDEYASQLEKIQVVGISLTTNNLTQATQNFVQKNYIPFKPATSENLPTSATVVAGESAVLHTFTPAFVSGSMNSLEMKLLKGETVKVTLKIVLPNLGSSSLPALS